jgi:hypothetical protein
LQKVGVTNLPPLEESRPEILHLVLFDQLH